MKKIAILTLAAALFVALSPISFAGNKKKAVPVQPDKVLLLYPEGQNVDKGIVENGVAVTLGPGESNGIESAEINYDYGGVSAIGDSARIAIYLPKKANGQMAVVCPGGGYKNVSAMNEGTYVADWLVRQGISVCVVYYRMPEGHWPVPLTDVQNAFRYCRAHAEEWGITQIGVMGFSAGGHLAASASTMFVDAVTRPDFSVLIYPVIDMGLYTHSGTHDNLIGKESVWLDESKTVTEYKEAEAQYNALMEKYSLQNRVTGGTPSTFLVACTDDGTVPVENSMMYFDALRANGVPVEFLIYPSGGHGWGFTTGQWGKDHLENNRSSFLSSLAQWFENQLPR